MTSFPRLAFSAFLVSATLATAATAMDTKAAEAFEVLFSSHDTDGDANLNPDEMFQMGQNVFVSMDSDNDRIVTKDEFLSWDIGIQDIAAASNRTEALSVAMEVFFDRLDQNNDRKFNSGEWRRLHLLGTDRADANGDELVTFDEFWNGFPIASAVRFGLGV